MHTLVLGLTECSLTSVLFSFLLSTACQCPQPKPTYFPSFRLVSSSACSCGGACLSFRRIKDQNQKTFNKCLLHAQGGCADVYTIRPCVVGAPGPVQLVVRDGSGRRGASTLQQDVLEVRQLPAPSAAPGERSLRGTLRVLPHA